MTGVLACVPMPQRNDSPPRLVADPHVATPEEVQRAYEALTSTELIKLRTFADRRIRGLGRMALGRSSDGLLVGKIEFGTADRYHLNIGGSRFHKAARQLALMADDKDLHLASCFTALAGRSRLPARPSRSPA